MFGFGWVRTQLGDVFLESMSFLLFLVSFLEKETKSTKSGNLQSPMSRRRDPTQ